MREIFVSIQVVTGLLSGVFFAAGLKVLGDGEMLKPLLSHFSSDTWLGIALTLFALSYGLWLATRDDWA